MTTTDHPERARDERIDALRAQIDECDAQIVDLIQRRLAVSREIGELRSTSGGTRLSLSRERQVIARFTNALGPEGSALGMLLLRLGRGRL